MTEIEAKALALVNDVRSEAATVGVPARLMIDAAADILSEALCRAIEREEATEARHAAEMREMKARFSEAVEAYGRLWSKRTPSRDEYTAHFAPFILPAPDPLVEIAREMTLLDGVVRTDNQKAAIREGRAGSTASEDFYDRLRAAMQARGYEWRKIGEAGE